MFRDTEKALNSHHVAAFTGLPGVGKTETAVEYAYRHRAAYQTVLWVGGESRQALIAGFGALASWLRLPEGEAKEQELAVAAVKRWLDSRDGWLFILDNADDLPMAREFIPHGGMGTLS